LLFALACAFLPLGDVKIIASVSSLGILLVFISVQCALVTLRFRRPALARPFRVPLSLGRLPLLPMAGIAACVALLTQFEAKVYVVAGLATAAGALIYVVMYARNSD